MIFQVDQIDLDSEVPNMDWKGENFPAFRSINKFDRIAEFLLDLNIVLEKGSSIAIDKSWKIFESVIRVITYNEEKIRVIGWINFFSHLYLPHLIA